LPMPHKHIKPLCSFALNQNKCTLSVGDVHPTQP
jgi:hypothetical protein